MKRLPVSPKEFTRKFQKNVQRVSNAVSDYLDNPDEENIHEVRTAIRRLETSFRLLPKKIRKRSPMQNYMKQCRDFFRINTEVRDCDIILGQFAKHSSNSMYNKLVSSLKNQRNSKLRSGSKIAISLSNSRLSQISLADLPKSKLRTRFDKIASKLYNAIEQNLPIVKTNIKKVDELHQLRKDCKKLRYSLELLSQNKKTSKLISYLEEVQNILGAIHDSDIVIEYLKRIERSSNVNDILNKEITDRNRKYYKFVQFLEECPYSIDSSNLIL